MKIIKPLRLSLMSRPYRMPGQLRMGISVLALATLDQEPLLQPEADLWRLAGEALGEDGVLDLGVPKPCAEFLVSGQAYTAHQRDRTACMARVRVGALQKTLAVFGERYWLDGRATEPQPFDALPVDWGHAYGGPAFADNPQGRGADEESIDGVRVRRLPNVEPLEGRLARPGQQPAPAGFGPVSPLWPRRFRRAGQYHASWLDDGFPGFLDTLDPHFFNAAEPDQWWAGQPELPVGADYEIWNMHPDRQRLTGRLPVWRARCVVRRQDSADIEDVPLCLTTAWFFPDRERVLLIYQGALEVLQDDGTDIALAMPALEATAAARPLSYYRDVLAQRLDPRDGAIHALQDAQLLPRAACGTWAALDMSNPLAGPFGTNQRARGEAMRLRMREEVLAAGLDPGNFEVAPLPRPAMPTLDELPDWMRQARYAAQEARIDLLHVRRKMAQQMRAEAAAMPPGMTPESLFAAVSADGAPGGPPSLRQHPGFAELTELARRQPLAAATGALDEAAMEAMMGEAEPHLRRLYLCAAHHQPAAGVAHPARSVRMRRRVQALLGGSRDLSGLDLTGVDLSGLDLSQARCVGTGFECADLSGTRLDGADLSQAVLARACVEGGSWRGVILAQANLGKARFSETDLAGARLSATVLDEVELERCDLSGAALHDCHLAGALVADCRFDGAALDTVTFWQRTRLVDTGFAGARMTRVTWLDCVLDGVDFERAQLSRCAWVQSQCEQPLRCRQTELVSCCAVQTDLDDAVFAGALLRECSLREISLAGADFAGATLLRCDLSEAVLAGASLQSARADESLFIRADLSGASLAAADLIGALLQKADLTHADLRGANLFRADLGQALLDDTTDTRGAYVHLANTRPARRQGAAS